MIKPTPIRAFQDNYIWLFGAAYTLAQDSRAVVLANEPTRVIVVDPGDARPVLAHLQSQNLELDAILVTHHHYDHIDGIPALLDYRPVPVFGPAAESIRGVDHPVGDGDQLSLVADRLSFEVMAVPGHTAGHIAFYGHGMLFCGDTLFGGGCGRLFEGTAAQMYDSLTRLTRLPDTTRIFCAHEYTAGNLRFAQAVEPENQNLLERIKDTQRLRAQNIATLPSTLQLEKNTNPFLRCAQPQVKVAAEQFAGRKLATDTEVFSVLRYWKDIF